VVLGIAFLLRGQYRRAALANLAYTWGYSVPVLLLAAAVLEACSSRRLRGFLWIAGASAAGFIIHPHFPSNLAVLWYQGFHVLSNTLSGNPAGVELPGELKSWQVSDYCVELWLPLLLLGVSLVRRTTKGWLACLQVVLCLLTFKMMRLIEYAVPFVCLTARPTLEYALEKASRSLRASILCLGLLGVGVTSLCQVVAAVKSDVRPSYRDVATWLHEHGGGAPVFNSNWGAYPELRYFCSASRIAQGHDAVFVAYYARERFKAMRAAIEGQMTLENFRKEFKYRFIVAERGAAILLAFADGRGVTKCFQDAKIVLLDLGG